MRAYLNDSQILARPKVTMLGNISSHTNTYLLLVAYPVRRLQALLQEGEAQLVYWRFVKIVLHETARDTQSYILQVLSAIFTHSLEPSAFCRQWRFT